MSDIVIVDTTVFVCILEIPGEDAERRNRVLAEFRACTQRGDFLLLPIATIIETGNWVARRGDWKVAGRYVKEVTRALEGQSPFRETRFFEKVDLLMWLAEFPEYAKRGVEMADFTLIKEAERQRELNPHRHVRIWSLDDDLA
jgi:hypothetical protein